MHSNKLPCAVVRFSTCALTGAFGVPLTMNGTTKRLPGHGTFSCTVGCSRIPISLLGLIHTGQKKNVAYTGIWCFFSFQTVEATPCQPMCLCIFRRLQAYLQKSIYRLKKITTIAFRTEIKTLEVPKGGAQGHFSSVLGENAYKRKRV